MNTENAPTDVSERVEHIAESLASAIAIADGELARKSGHLLKLVNDK